MVSEAREVPPSLADRQSEQTYEKLMSPGRFWVRKQLLAILDKEMPLLHSIQRHTKHPWTESYFHLVSLLGTHSSFLILLPLLFWFGVPTLGLHMLIILSTGVYLSSFLKDLVCVPRPYSPPVERMTLVGSHAMEYGWPSTHSTNALGICLIASQEVDTTGKLLLAFYALSVIAGRIYLGMHSFSDCLGGCTLAVLQYLFLRPFFSAILNYIDSGLLQVPFLLISASVIMISIHPQPVDPCPCFEDAVAFISVLLGILLSKWYIAWASFEISFELSTPLHHGISGWVVFAGLKILVGVSVLLIWRIAAKQVLHLVLPFLIRVSAPYLSNPRRFYEPSNTYKESYQKEEPPVLHPVPSAIHLPDLSPPSSPSAILRRNAAKRQINTLKATEANVPPDAEPESHRKQYDADVATKMVVYAGIGAWAAFGLPVIFHAWGWAI